MTPKASPISAVRENATLVLTSRPTPASAVTSPARNTRLGLWRNRIHAASVTKIAARLASSVELATDVSLTEKCQKTRSPVNAMAVDTSSHPDGFGEAPASALRPNAK